MLNDKDKIKTSQSYLWHMEKTLNIHINGKKSQIIGGKFSGKNKQSMWIRNSLRR